MSDEIKVVELFAGVGGFRLGLEGASDRFKIVWSNQYEPSTKVQHASDIYVKNFGPVDHSNTDISKVPTSDIPPHDLLVGGFPCQDYSVARTLNKAEGLVGKKGVLWWEIYRIVENKLPQYLLLENVDRLLKSPVAQRGRDFAIMLASLSDLGYAVEWRVINAAHYGMPQRRRRIFITAYHKSSSVYAELLKINKPFDWIREHGIFAEAFPVKFREAERSDTFPIPGTVEEISEEFNLSKSARNSIANDQEFLKRKPSTSPFENAGLVFERTVSTVDTQPTYSGEQVNLGDILQPQDEVPAEYYVSENIERWKYLKGSKNEVRRNKATGFEYSYNEGPMTFPDDLNTPSRTIITGEGGPTPSRFKHVITCPDGRLRRLTPIELERLNMFPDNHTEGVSDIKRAFFMGNALVVGIVQNIGAVLARRIEIKEPQEVQYDAVRRG